MFSFDRIPAFVLLYERFLTLHEFYVLSFNVSVCAHTYSSLVTSLTALFKVCKVMTCMPKHLCSELLL